MSKRSRDKGKRGEREAVELLKEVWPDCRRNLSQSRTAKAEGPDILGTGPYHFEVKRGSVKNCNLRNAWIQASDEAGMCIPVALTRVDHEEWLVALDWHAFSGILAENQRLQAEAESARLVAVRVAKAGADVEAGGAKVTNYTPTSDCWCEQVPHVLGCRGGIDCPHCGLAHNRAFLCPVPPPGVAVAPSHTQNGQ